MPSLLDQLRRAVLEGAALASTAIYVGCAHSSEDHAKPDAAKPVGAEDAAKPVGAEDAATTALDAAPSETTTIAELKPYPIDRVGCFGKDFGNDIHPGFQGQCCVRAQCYTPSDPSKCMGDAGAELPGRPWIGDGTCSCSPPDDAGRPAPPEGPYAPNPDHTPTSPGSCCYLVATIKCDGRPLIVDGALVVADVVERNDWAFVA